MIDEQTIDEIVQTVHSQGQITKARILEAWAIQEEDYAELQRRVISEGQFIQKGPPRVGGFVVQKRKGRLPDDGAASNILLREEWEERAVLRLSELLQHAELEELLGPVLQAIRQSRKEQTGVDRRGAKPELAAALVIRHGIDLFCDAEVREKVARACKVNNPGKWHPGKAAAIEFVLHAGFPRELAGVPTPEGLPDYEYLEGRYKPGPLRDFQEEVKASLLHTLRTPGDRAIVTLPTGAGKTRVAVEAIRDWLTDAPARRFQVPDKSAVLWLAHTEELCEQAYSCFKQVWEVSEHACPLYLFRFWGGYTQDLAKHREVLQQLLTGRCILISTPQRIVNLLDHRILESEHVLKDLEHALGLLVIDEAHRAAAPSYKRILRDMIPAAGDVSIAGLTATPFRGEYLEDDPEAGTKELKDLIVKLIEPINTLGPAPRQRLQDMGILATPVFDTITTDTTIKIPDLPQGNALSEEEMERIDRVMAVKANKPARRLEVLKHLLPVAKNDSNSILYFGPSVADAECMAFLLRQEGISAAFVCGETRDVTRRQVVAQFKQKKIRVLCNCEVLTTGFDAPQVTHIIMARPTVSRVLYEQVIGRGLRGPEFGGTQKCVIMNCEDNFKGGKPQLGYELARRIWNEATIVEASKRDRLPAASDALRPELDSLG